MSKFANEPGELLGPDKTLFLERTHKNLHRDWYGDFQCSLCGNIFNASIQSVKRGDTKSCGCLRRSIMSDIGKQNIGRSPSNTKYKEGDIVGPNLMKIIKIIGTSRGSYREGTFQCPHCGKPFNTNIYNVISGHTISCGCINSKGESLINSLLIENHILFETQKTFLDCLSLKSCLLKFDFFLTDLKILIEYDGEQHSIARNSGFYTLDSLQNLQERDQIKNQYCLSHNIKLIRIPYLDYNLLNWEYLREKIYDNS